MPRRPRYKTAIHGLLVVDKPSGLSSAQVVTRVRFAAGNCKTGHAGTLDPLATGVLICCLGDATKVADRLMTARKAYVTDVDLSAFTATDDREAPPEPVPVDRPPDLDAVRAACAAMTGWIEQTPPAYSAVHVEGRRAYELARQGRPPDIKPRRVHIEAIELRRYAWPIATLVVTCGKGTYIRAIARSLGERLGTGGHCATLRRTAVGPYTLEHARTLERIDEGITQADLLPIPLTLAGSGQPGRPAPR